LQSKNLDGFIWFAIGTALFLNPARSLIMKDTIDGMEDIEKRIEEFREALDVIRTSLRNDKFETARRATQAFDIKLCETLEALKKRTKSHDPGSSFSDR
jgi:hypothetical protein